jgi:hyperosmotically inducible protein
MKMRIWPLMAAITCTVAISSAYADGDVKYPAPDEILQAHAPKLPSARKAMRAADRKLSRDVRKAIGKGGDVDMSRLEVIARSGKVTLAGSVPEEDQVDLATQRAKSVSGVVDVANRVGIDVPGGH